MKLMTNDKDSDFLAEGGEHEHRSEEAAFKMWLRVFVTVRWIAVLGILAATFVASRVFDIEFPYRTRLRGLRLCRPVQPGAPVPGTEPEEDAVQPCYPKGAESTAPFISCSTWRRSPCCFILPAGSKTPLSSTSCFTSSAPASYFTTRSVYLLATSAIVMVALLVGLEYAGVIPHFNLGGFVRPTLYRQGSYILAVLAVLAALSSPLPTWLPRSPAS